MDPNKPLGLISNTSSVVFITTKITYIRFSTAVHIHDFHIFTVIINLSISTTLSRISIPFFTELVRAAEVVKMKLKLFSNMAESLPPIF